MFQDYIQISSQWKKHASNKSKCKYEKESEFSISEDDWQTVSDAVDLHQLRCLERILLAEPIKIFYNPHVKVCTHRSNDWFVLAEAWRTAGRPLSYILELHSHLAQLVGENKGTTDYIGKRGGLFGSTVQHCEQSTYTCIFYLNTSTCKCLKSECPTKNNLVTIVSNFQDMEGIASLWTDPF